MSAAEVDALLERLVAQFESPYDFLRELVQNAMDAGSDRVEVGLETHPIPGEADSVVFELTIMDTGAGMDEAIIDRELTRLFSSGKSGDRTMAGGFGIGFVSVFAWKPEAVLVHTGRGGESWELLFYADRSFDKIALDSPVEGTTVSLFRRGRAREREGIAEAVRESLWRWARFSPLEVSFEDLEGEGPPELIQDSPEPGPGQALGLSRTEERGEATLRVSFAVPANAVFLRRGLILAEGGPRELLTGIAERLGQSCEHLQVWADSPQLRTTLARDKVVDDEGRERVEARLLALVEELREELVARLEVLARTGDDRPPQLQAQAEDDERVDPLWTRERHLILANLHAHLSVELDNLGSRVRGAAVLRDLAHGRAISLTEARSRMKTRPLLVATPPALRGAAEPGPIAAGVDRLIRALRPTRFPVLAAALGDDDPWLAALVELEDEGLSWLPVERAIARVEPLADEGAGLCGLIESLLRGLGHEELRVVIAEFADVQGRPERSPLFGPEVVGAGEPLAFHGGRYIPRASLRRRRLWLNRHNTLVEAGIASFAQRPLLAGLALAAAIIGQLDKADEVGDLAKIAEGLERDAEVQR